MSSGGSNCVCLWLELKYIHYPVYLNPYMKVYTAVERTKTTSAQTHRLHRLRSRLVGQLIAVPGVLSKVHRGLQRATREAAAVQTRRLHCPRLLVWLVRAPGTPSEARTGQPWWWLEKGGREEGGGSWAAVGGRGQRRDVGCAVRHLCAVRGRRAACPCPLCGVRGAQGVAGVVLEEGGGQVGRGWSWWDAGGRGRRRRRVCTVLGRRAARLRPLRAIRAV